MLLEGAIERSSIQWLGKKWAALKEGVSHTDDSIDGQNPAPLDSH